MSTLSAAFSYIGYIYIVYFLIIIIYGMIGKIIYQGKLWVIALINIAGLIGLSSLVLIPFYSPYPIEVDKFLVVILIELICAIYFAITILRIAGFLSKNLEPLKDQQILILLFLKLVFVIANYIAAGGEYGIFSTGSRIDFIQISPIISRLWYLDMLFDFIINVSVILSCIIYKVRLKDILFISVVVLLSYIGGSKGASFLLLFYSILIVYIAKYKFINISIKKYFIMIMIFIIGIPFYIYKLSQFNNVLFTEQLTLTIARFLLSADARIMSFDPNVTKYVIDSGGGANLLSELFRGPARLFGFYTAEFPIGIYQYQYEVGTTGYVGSTNQLSAMFSIYLDQYFLFSLLIVVGLMVIIYKFFVYNLNYGGLISWLSLASIYWLAVTFSQGYDAYVQLAEISIFTVLFLRLFLTMVNKQYRVKNGS